MSSSVRKNYFKKQNKTNKTNKQTNKQTNNKQTNKQTNNKQTNKQIDNKPGNESPSFLASLLTELTPSWHLVLKRTFAFWNIPFFNET